MIKEQLEKIQVFETQIKDSTIPLEEIEMDYDVWCYAAGWAWNIIHRLSMKVFAGLPPAQTMLVQHSHRTEQLEKLILQYYKKINNKLPHGDNSIKTRVIVSVFMGKVEADLPDIIDQDHQNIVLYGYNNH